MTVRLLDLPAWAVGALVVLIGVSLIARIALAWVDIRLKSTERSLRALDLAERWETIRQAIGRL